MAATSSLFVLLSIATLVFGDASPYIQVYPPNDNDTRTELHFALVLSFGGEYVSIGALPGVQIALDYINDEPTILPGYSLHYTLVNSSCEQSYAFRSFHEQINFPPIKVGWIGSGCSVATEPTAALTQYYNLVQLSCISSSPELRNRERYRYYFQLLATEVLIAEGFYGIIRHFDWKRVGIISQGENIFTQSVDNLRKALEARNVDVREKRFRSDDGTGSIAQPFDSDVRIYILAMYSQHARDLLCKAYKSGLRYPQYTFITYGWYARDWWQQGDCANEVASLLVNSYAPVIQEFPSELNLGDIGDLGWYVTEYFQKLDNDYNEDINLKNYIDDFEWPFLYSYHCYEATLAFAYALNLTINDLSENDTLNRRAAEESYIPENDTFTMANFNYNNSVVGLKMFEHMSNTMFPGITENEVRFDENGIRAVDTVVILQYQNNSNGVLSRLEVANVTEDNNNTIKATSALILEYGIPYDGTPIDEIVAVNIGLAVVYIFLGTVGIIFTAVCLIFTLIFRKKKLIRLSSPNLNYLIGLGAILLYLNAIALVIPTRDERVATFICNLIPWLTSLGYSLCYGTILIKMLRVWLIFNKPLGLKASFLQDYTMIFFVLTLVIIDLTILVIYTVTLGVKGNLGVRAVSNEESPQEIVGPTAEVHRHLIYVCESEGIFALYAVLYGYKGLLTVIALVLAFRTRKVKVKGLNDSKYIAASIYVTSIVLAVIIVSTYTLERYLNAYPAVIGMGLLLGTTAILALVFVPRMVELYKDPQGDKITFMSSVTDRPSENELVLLRKRISQLEKSLKGQPTFEERRSSVDVLEESFSNGANNNQSSNGPMLNTV